MIKSPVVSHNDLLTSKKYNLTLKLYTGAESSPSPCDDQDLECLAINLLRKLSKRSQPTPLGFLRSMLEQKPITAIT